MAASMIRYLTVGNLTIDDIYGPDGDYHEGQCGGNCLYAAVGAHIWSNAVGIMSLAGHDYPPEWLERVRAAGIDTRAIRPHSTMPTMRASMVYDDSWERSILDDDNSRRHEMNRRQDEWADWQQHSPSVAQLPAGYEALAVTHLAPMPIQAHIPLVAALRGPGRRVTLDSPWWDGAAGNLEPILSLLEGVDALLPSMAEIRAFFQHEIAPKQAARTLAQMGPDAVVIKLGAQGCLVYVRATNQLTHVRPFPAVAVDPTGAGDAFCGGFMVGLDETGDPVQAACYGTVSASFAVEGFSSLYALSVERAAAEARLPGVLAITV